MTCIQIPLGEGFAGHLENHARDLRGVQTHRLSRRDRVGSAEVEGDCPLLGFMSESARATDVAPEALQANSVLQNRLCSGDFTESLLVFTQDFLNPDRELTCRYASVIPHWFVERSQQSGWGS
jgi:hypothetical protein